jgi:hypothetical protein
VPLPPVEAYAVPDELHVVVGRQPEIVLDQANEYLVCPHGVDPPGGQSASASVMTAATSVMTAAARSLFSRMTRPHRPGVVSDWSRRLSGPSGWTISAVLTGRRQRLCDLSQHHCLSISLCFGSHIRLKVDRPR